MKLDNAFNYQLGLDKPRLDVEKVTNTFYVTQSVFGGIFVPQLVITSQRPRETVAREKSGVYWNNTGMGK